MIPFQSAQNEFLQIKRCLERLNAMGATLTFEQFKELEKIYNELKVKAYLEMVKKL